VGEIRSGEHFYFLDPSDERTFLVQFRENPEGGKTEPFWKSNAIHQPVLLYKDWYQVRNKEKEFSSSSFEIPFLEIFALPVPATVLLGSRIDLVLVSRGPERIEKIHVTVDHEYLLTFDADFTAGSHVLFSLDVRVPGLYALHREVNGREVELLAFNADRPPVPLMSLQRNRSDAIKQAIPFVWEKASFSPLEELVPDEALYFSLRDVLDPEAYARLDFSAYEQTTEPRSFGITRLLNAIKLLPKQEELKLIQQLFQDDFSLGEYLLTHYFPYVLIFYLRQEILSDVLAEVPGILLNLIVRNEEKFRREKLVASLDPVKARQLDALAHVPVKETDIRKAKESFLSFCRAWLQKSFGIILNIRRIRNQVFASSSFVPSQAGLLQWRLEGRLLHVDFILSGRFRTPEVLVWNRISESAPFCVPVCKWDDGLFLRFEQDFEVVQIVKDAFSLAREELLEWRNVKTGQFVRIALEGRMLRLKIGALDRNGLKEAMFDIIVCGTLGADIILEPDSEEPDYPVRLLKSEGKSKALFSSFFFNRDFLIFKNEVQTCSAPEEDLQVRCGDAPLVWHLYMDISRMAARVELRTNRASHRRRSAIQPVMRPFSGDAPTATIRFGFEESGSPAKDSTAMAPLLGMFEDRFRKSENALVTAVLTMLTYRHFVLTGGDGLKERLGFHLRKLNSAVHSNASLEMRERLHIYFLLKEMFDASPSYLKLWIDSMLTALFQPVGEGETSHPDRVMYDYIRSLLHLGEVSRESRDRLVIRMKEFSRRTNDAVLLLRSARLLKRHDSAFSEKLMKSFEGKIWETDLLFWDPFLAECLSLLDSGSCVLKWEQFPSQFPWETEYLPTHHLGMSVNQNNGLVEFVFHPRNPGKGTELILLHGDGLEFCSASEAENLWKPEGFPEDLQMRSFLPSHDAIRAVFYILDVENARLRIFYRDCLDPACREMLRWQPGAPIQSI
jgi:hypothetical protein